MNLHSIKAAAVAKKRSISAQATQSGQQVSTSVENVDNPVAKKEGVDTTQFAPDRPQEQQWMSQEELDSLKGDSFDFLKVSLSSVAVWVGLSIFTASILVYLFAPDENELLLSATPLTIVIGFILATLGFAFTYAELKPLPYSTTRSANTLRAAQATGIQTQILSDMTSYLYGGEEQHLEDALVAIFKVGKPKGLKKKRVPTCVGISEEVFKTNDNRERYATVLHFTSPRLRLENWLAAVPQIERYFGPNITAKIRPTNLNKLPKGLSEADVDVLLISESDEGQKQVSEEQEDDLLPPLMPGMPVRVRKKESATEESE